jgi:hypothetical protein
MRRPGEPGRDDHPMRDDEERSFTRVIETLGAAFPAVPLHAVEACVQRLREKYADARVRTYLPILVTREAGAALRSFVAREEPVGVG